LATTHRPAHDLSYLLHKHPEWLQSFDLSFGKAHVYDPEVAADRSDRDHATGLGNRPGRRE
jgi:hypothetical protein